MEKEEASKRYFEGLISGSQQIPNNDKPKNPDLDNNPNINNNDNTKNNNKGALSPIGKDVVPSSSILINLL